MKTTLGVFLALCLASVASAQVAYSFRASGEGGGGYVHVNPKTGKIESHRLLFREAGCKKAKKVRFTASGSRVAVTAASGKTPSLFIADVEAGGTVLRVALPGEPDELRAVGESYVITCEGGVIALVDGKTGAVRRTWSAATELSPPARNAEDVTVFDNGSKALVSFESEHRLIILDLPGLSLRADIKLPFGVDGSGMPGGMRSRGPQPEVVLVSEKGNTILATLDSYGAVGLLDLAVGLEGRVDGAVYEATAPDKSWGTSYPDRAALFAVAGKDYALVTNVGRAGGAVLVDMAGRRIVKRLDVPHGLEKPCYLAGAKVAVAAPAGKLKGPGVGRTYVPGSAVYLFDFGVAAAAEAVAVENIEIGQKVFYVKPVASANSSIVVLAAGANAPDQVLTFDVKTRQVIDSQPAFGPIKRLDVSAGR